MSMSADIQNISKVEVESGEVSTWLRLTLSDRSKEVEARYGKGTGFGGSVTLHLHDVEECDALLDGLLAARVQIQERNARNYTEAQS